VMESLSSLVCTCCCEGVHWRLTQAEEFGRGRCRVAVAVGCGGRQCLECKFLMMERKLVITFYAKNFGLSREPGRCLPIILQANYNIMIKATSRRSGSKEEHARSNKSKRGKERSIPCAMCDTKFSFSSIVRSFQPHSCAVSCLFIIINRLSSLSQERMRD